MNKNAAMNLDALLFISQADIDRWIKKRAEARLLFEKLTDREQEVLRFAAEGEPIKGTAAKLFISRKTVEQHRLRLTKKLGVHNMLAAVVIYTQCSFEE